MPSFSSLRVACLSALIASSGMAAPEPQALQPFGPPLGGTDALNLTGDIASNLVAGVDRFLDVRLAAAAAARRDRWNVEFGPEANRGAAEATNRFRLAKMLGVVEPRAVPAGFEWVASTLQASLIATSGVVRAEAIRWGAFGEVHGEGLLLTPTTQAAVADVVAVPDAEVTPEQLIGIEPGVARKSQYARRLAESGCRVVVPFLINRKKGESKVDWDPQRGRNLNNREYLHRAAFEMGRTLAGYEVLKILAAVDVLRQDAPDRPVGVMGWGEGGRLSLYAAALDPRLGAACVSGYFQPREGLWREPLDRNVFGLIQRFGDAELAALMGSRALVIEAALAPDREFASDGGAPGRLTTPVSQDVKRELQRARDLTQGWNRGPRLVGVESDNGKGPPGSSAALAAFLEALRPGMALREDAAGFVDLRRFVDSGGRADRQRRELDQHTQSLLVDSARVRDRFMEVLRTSTPERFAATQERYRQFFAEEVIGRFDESLAPFHAQSRAAYDATAWRGYEVVLDVFPDVIAYGLLLVPKDLREGERRPVVVCQHGLEGRPQDTIGKAGFDAYSAFSAKLADQGYIVFAPQNLYLFRDRFRVLQRKANPLGKTLFSIITPQHQQIVNWLKTLPFVDAQRIAFYGLSYGGKTAMRVPGLVTDYCLSICSADFNEWVWKNTSTRSPYSYVWSGEYEIFEWNLGHTFNYAEMAALIAPRPFMVERGHFDGVAPDETVGLEFAKVRRFYAAQLKLPPESCQIEWFVGPHQIHGVGTFEFLQRHLRWPATR